MSVTRLRVTVDRMQGAWAILPTPAKPAASSWRAADTVDLDETARAVDGLIQAGVDGILALGTLGECATLTWAEKCAFVATAVEAAAGRVPFFAGTTTLGTRDTIEQTRALADKGIDGTMLGLPMWCSVDLPMAVQFYRDVAEACPDTAICVYANPEAFRFNYPPPFWAQMSQIPQVVAAKYLGVGPLLNDLGASGRTIRLLPIDADYYGAARMDPDFCTGFWTSGAVCGPSLAIRLRDEIKAAVATGNWDKARVLSAEIGQSLAPMIPRGSIAEFGKYNIGLEKERMNAAGWMKAGPPRPPYHLVPEEYLAGARRSGQLWADLARKYDGGA